MEQVEVASQPAMVALARLLEPVEVLFELLLPEERGPVDPLQHLAIGVATPVRAGGVQQLEVLEPTGAGDVGPATEVGERPVGVDRDHLVVAEFADPLQLERIVGEAAVGLVAIDHLAHEGVVGPHHLDHPGLDRRDVLGRERPRHLEVVVEPVLDRRTESDAGLGEDLPDGGGEHVGGRVPQHLERRRIALGEDRHCGAIVERSTQITDRPVDGDRHRGAGEAGTDRGRQVGAGRPRRQLARRAIGEGHGNRGRSAGRHGMRVPRTRVRQRAPGMGRASRAL